MKKTNKEKMLSGELYTAEEPILSKEHAEAALFNDAFNATAFGDYAERERLCRQRFASVGANFTINKPAYFDYGTHIHVGNNFYANFDCVFLDVADIYIGDHCFIAPRVSFFTAGHPTDKEVRNELLEFGKPIHVGNDVWIGGGSVINPGVTIGDDVVIGSGSIVTKNIPSHVIAAGNPCRVIREISEQEKAAWRAKRDLYYQTIKK